MNSKNTTTRRELKDTWLCIQCGETIIPFEKNLSGSIIEGILFLAGIGVLFLFNFIIGGIFILVSIFVMIFRSSGKQNVCPSCESANIVPSQSPMARKLAG